jgi:hypothetical protein
MTWHGDVMTSADASHALGVSVRQVQRLVAKGDLEQVGMVGRSVLLSPESVQRLRIRGVRQGRPWQAETIAAALELLSNGRTERLDSVELGRLHGRLKTSTVEQVVQAMRARAEVSRYRSSVSFLPRLGASVAQTGLSAIDADAALASEFGLGQAPGVGIDGYVDEQTAAALIRSCRLIDDPQGNVTLRTTTIDVLHATNPVAVAIDLVESLDPRARNAGVTLLRNRLQRLA